MDAKKKAKALEKYISFDNSKRQHQNSAYGSAIEMIDNDQIIQQERSSSQSQSSQYQTKRKRMYSSDENKNDQSDEDEIKKQARIRKKIKKQQSKKEKEMKVDRKIKKKLQKAFGIEKQEDIDEFLGNLQIDGIDRTQLHKYLKNNKKDITVEQDKKKKKSKKNKEQKVKIEGQNIKNDQNLKYQMFEKSSSSDLEIPQQSRTIYRNKDGTIRQISQKQEEEKKKQAVNNRLAEWQKGIKNKNNYRQAENSDHEPDADQDVNIAKSNKIWDDPMKRWEEKSTKKFLTCKFEGPANRFSIKPGFRWDGVARGNGFENRYLQEINIKKSQKDREYKDYMKGL